MKRLTTETPDGNFETMLNFVFSQDGWAHIRHDSEEGAVPLAQWSKAQCILHGCGEFSAETPQEIDEEISDCLMMDFPDCPIALAYGFAVQACHLRDRLKMYEDIFFADDGTERLTLDDLCELAGPNTPLTEEQLREMVGRWVWVDVYYKQTDCRGWAFIATLSTIGFLDQTLSTKDCGERFDAYPRKPKEIEYD